MGLPVQLRPSALMQKAVEQLAERADDIVASTHNVSQQLQQLQQSLNSTSDAMSTTAIPGQSTPDVHAVVNDHHLLEEDGEFHCLLCEDSVEFCPEGENLSEWAERRCRLYAYSTFYDTECLEY